MRLHAAHEGVRSSSRPGLGNLPRLLLFLLAFSALFAFTGGCSKGEGGGPVAAEEGTYERGYFVDSPVMGLDYSSDSFAGETESDGGFLYSEGQVITFSIGDIVLGRTRGDRIVTPVTLGGSLADVTNTRVINIARLLQSLDADRNPANGITITPSVKQALAGIRIDLARPDIDNDAGIAELFERLSGMGIYPEEAGELGLVSAEEARLHLEDTVTRIELEEEAAQEALRSIPVHAFITNGYTGVIMIPGQKIRLVAYAFGGTPPYVYSWSLDGASPFSTRQDAGSYTAPSPSDPVVSLRVADSLNAAYTAFKRIHVQPSQSATGVSYPEDSIPTARIISPRDGDTFAMGEVVTFKALITDGDLPIHYGWLSNKPSNVMDTAHESVSNVAPRAYLVSIPVTLKAHGDHSIGIAVQDTPVKGKGPDNHASLVSIRVY